MRWLLAPFLGLSCLTGAGTAAWSADPEIWFNPHPTLDWQQLFSDAAPWQNAASHVQVMEVVYWWLDTATDAQVQAIGDFAREHHMKIDLEIAAVGITSADTCGVLEGYTTIGILTSEAGILKRNGITPDVMTMDEPVAFGHYDPGGCMDSADKLAARVVANIAGTLAMFPNIQLYEIEPVPFLTGFSDWRNVEAEFQNKLQQMTGKSVRGMQLDIGWPMPSWQQAVRDIRQFTHNRNMTWGPIADPSSNANSNAAAVASVVQQYEYMEGTMGLIPDMVIFTTWTPYPQYSMPETSPDAQTWAIDRYFRPRTMMQAQFVGQGAHGKLTTTDGLPVAGATINGYVPGVDFGKPLPVIVNKGVVPSNAVTALMGIRLNTECDCQGLNDVLVGTLQYQETQGGSASFSFLYPPAPGSFNGAVVGGEWVGGSLVTRFITTSPTQTVYPNSAFFPVTAGAQYTFTVPASTIGGEGWYGDVFLVWVDINGNGIGRITLVPGPGKRLMSSATTAADGRFKLPNLPRVGPGSFPVTIEYAGDDTHRFVAWSPLR